MQWSEFLDTAERLAQGTTEGDWRSAMSRGYYAAFHYFRDWLQANGLPLGRGGQSHFNLYTGLLNCGITAIAAVGSRIDSLRELRVRADYELQLILTQPDAALAVRESRLLIVDFQVAVASSGPGQIVAGARRFLQSAGRLKPGP